MFLFDVPVNYWGVLVAALILYILGALWYSPLLFGDTCMPKKECSLPDDKKKCCYSKVSGYIGEFINSLLIAYVLAVFIEISEADQVVEGITVAIWAWLGFIITTHFSAVLWNKKPFNEYLIHMCFLLIGFIVMGAAIMWMGIP